MIENVEGSGLPTQDTLDGDHGLVLCGAMFGARMYRHRLFETSHPVPPPHHPRHDTPASRAGHWEPGTFVSVAGHCGPAWLVREAMGIDWATLDEIAEAIPPAFTRYIGEYLVERLRYSSQRKEV